MHEGHNLKAFLDRRRELRRNQTPPEELVWSYLRNRYFFGYKFNRQYGIGPYILDFYCHELHLAIELDGDHHLQQGQRAYDQERTDFLAEQGVSILRFPNETVTQNISNVLQAIRHHASLP